MELTVELHPDLVLRLQVEADVRGVTLSEHVQTVLEEVVKPLKTPNPAEVENSGPERLINEAVWATKEKQIRNRELAVQVMTQKHNLQAEVDKAERIIREMERKANEADKADNPELAEQFRKQKALHERTLAAMRENLVIATEAATRVKEEIRKEEETLRERIVDALLLKTLIKQARINGEINDALDWLNPEHESKLPTGAWKIAFDTWMGSLDAKTKEIIEQKRAGRLKRTVVRLKRKFTKGKRAV